MSRMFHLRVIRFEGMEVGYIKTDGSSDRVMAYSWPIVVSNYFLIWKGTIVSLRQFPDNLKGKFKCSCFQLFQYRSISDNCLKNI